MGPGEERQGAAPWALLGEPARQGQRLFEAPHPFQGPDLLCGRQRPDGDDHGLGYAVKEAGNESFVFATDFPHESFDAKSCRVELQHILSREDLTLADKEAILGKNAKKFYGVD